MRLQRLQKGENSEGVIRTSEVFGDLDYPIEVGKSLVMWAQPLTPGMNVRMVTTSPIAKIEPIQGGVIFTTQSGSVYQLDDVKEPSSAS